MAMFHVGQKVVCVNDDFPEWTDFHKSMFPHRPCKGEVYTVRAIVPHIYEGGMHLLLEEIRNVELFAYEPPFGRYRFRPVRETSIECFRALLKTKPSDLPQDADADLEVAR